MTLFVLKTVIDSEAHVIEYESFDGFLKDGVRTPCRRTAHRRDSVHGVGAHQGSDHCEQHHAVEAAIATPSTSTRGDCRVMSEAAKRERLVARFPRWRCRSANLKADRASVAYQLRGARPLGVPLQTTIDAKFRRLAAMRRQIELINHKLRRPYTAQKRQDLRRRIVYLEEQIAIGLMTDAKALLQDMRNVRCALTLCDQAAKPPTVRARRQ